MITYHPKIYQGTDQWFDLRRGILTASEMKLCVTAATLKKADNDKSRSHLFELLAQRITGYTEPTYINDDMLRGQEDEIYARTAYSKHYEPVTECGFITNDEWGFTLGYSPDGLVGDDGQIESKSRRQKFQIETILADEMPIDYRIQVQTGLLVSARKWCDFISYSGGLPMFVKRVVADIDAQAAIVGAATDFYNKLEVKLAEYHAAIDTQNYIQTKRVIREEIFV